MYLQRLRTEAAGGLRCRIVAGRVEECKGSPGLEKQFDIRMPRRYGEGESPSKRGQPLDEYFLAEDGHPLISGILCRTLWIIS
jgi:hypothetical protein